MVAAMIGTARTLLSLPAAVAVVAVAGCSTDDVRNEVEKQVEDVTGLTAIQDEVKKELGTDNLDVRSVSCRNPGIDLGRESFTLSCTAKFSDGTKKVVKVEKRPGGKLTVTAR